MKKIITITLLILMSFSLYAWNKTGEESSAKEKKDETETVETGVERKEHPFANQNYIYKKWKKGIMQISKKTGKRQMYEQKKVWMLAYVTEDMLYYKSGGMKKTILYGVPIVKKSGSSSKETTELDFKNKEEILSEKGGYFGDVYVASDYILYLFRDDGGTEKAEHVEYAIKYTKKTGKKEYFEMERISYDISYVEKNRFIFGCGNLDGYYCLDLNTDEMTHFATEFYDTTAKDINPHAGYDEKFFYGAGDKKIMVYDMKNKQDSLFISKKEIQNFCMELAKNVKNGKYQSYYLADMFCYEGKLYIQVQLDWEKGEKEHMNYVMLSVDLENLETEKKLLYEEEITELMQGNSDEVSSWKYVYNSGRFLTIVDDMAILVFHNEVFDKSGRWKNDKRQIATYNMKTKKFKKVRGEYSKRYMVGYYLPYSDSTEPYYLAGGYMNFMPGYFFD